MKKAVSIFALILICASPVFSQLGNQNDDNEVIVVRDPKERAPSLSVGLLFGAPRGDFEEIYDGVPVGFGGQLLFNLGQSPLELGLDGSWQSMGNNSDDIRILAGQDSEGNNVYERGEIDVNNNIYTYHAVGRFKPFSGRFQIYGDILGGFKTYSTKTKIESEESSAQAEAETNKEFRDFAVSYGWAAGMKFRLTRSFAVEARFSNLKGGKTEYVDPDSVEIGPEGGLTYDTNESATDIMTFQAGISFEF